MRMIILVALVGCASHAISGEAKPIEPTSMTRTVQVEITKAGFVPADFSVALGDVVTFVFTRKVEHTCVKHVIVSLASDRKLDRELPMEQPVAITLHFDRAGDVELSCPMRMYGAVIHVAG